MKILRDTLCLLFLFFFSANSEAQDTTFIFTYPSAKEVDVSVKANVLNLGTKFNYEYELQSLSTSRQDVWSFTLNYDGNTENRSAPNGWIVLAPRNTNHIGWSSDDSTSDIPPGNSLTGFRFQSTGLPSIKAFYVEGFIELPVLETDPDSIIGGGLTENSKMGKTIGPKPAPVPFVAVVFIDTLISYTNQSLTLGWTANQLTADKYTSLFSTARSQLESNDTTGARTTLTTVLTNVTGDSAAALLISEAYALLRFNTEYLLDQLPSPELIIDIDIKPGSDPNSINCKNQNGMIPVAILTTDTFEASTVDPLTVRFGRTGTEASEAHNKGHIEDADGDGDLDMVLHFRFGDTGIQCGDTEATLTGQTNDGKQIRGTDAIQTVGQ